MSDKEWLLIGVAAFVGWYYFYAPRGQARPSPVPLNPDHPESPYYGGAPVHTYVPPDHTDVPDPAIIAQSNAPEIAHQTIAPSVVNTASVPSPGQATAPATAPTASQGASPFNPARFGSIGIAGRAGGFYGG